MCSECLPRICDSRGWCTCKRQALELDYFLRDFTIFWESLSKNTRGQNQHQRGHKWSIGLNTFFFSRTYLCPECLSRSVTPEVGAFVNGRLSNLTIFCEISLFFERVSQKIREAKISKREHKWSQTRGRHSEHRHAYWKNSVSTYGPFMPSLVPILVSRIFWETLSKNGYENGAGNYAQRAERSDQTL